MKHLLSNIKISVPESIYVKDPETSKLGKRIIEHSILLINEIGFEAFTFKKLGVKIKSNESSIYRYFESKHKLLVYLTAWYWAWIEYQLVFETANIDNSLEKLKRGIKVVTRTTMEDPSILEVDGVIIEFNNRMVLQDVYLKVEVGEIVALSGRNGTGKTTLLNYISGIGKMSTGSIRINHQRIESKYRYKHIQLLPQFHFIPSGLTVKQVLKDHHLKIDTLIHVFPLFKDKATQRIKTLSGG